MKNDNIIMINKYQNSKTYKITDRAYTKCYIGSTVEYLSNRMAKHRYDYKKWCDCKKGYCRSFDLFEEFGIDNVIVELIEKYPCEDKEELHAREGHYIKNTECINKNIMGRTDQEYHQDNRDKILKQVKEYSKANKEHKAQYLKSYYKNNPDVREKQKEQQKQQITCECGCVLQKKAQSKHLKSLKHQNYKNQNNQQEQTNSS